MPIDPRVQAFLDRLVTGEVPVLDAVQEQRREADRMVEAMPDQDPMWPG